MIKFLPEYVYEEHYFIMSKKEASTKGSLWYQFWSERIETFQKSATLKNEVTFLESLNGHFSPTIHNKDPKTNQLTLTSKADYWLVNLDIQSLSLTEKLTLAISMLKALKALHSNNVLHLALRPSSFLVTHDLTYAELIDFTAAQHYSRETAEIAAFRPLWVDEHFIAPEQAYIHGQSMDVRTDLYSFGNILYWLFYCRLPYAEKGDANLFYAQIAENIDLTEKTKYHHDSEQINMVLKSLLEKGVDNRYQSTSGLLAELTLIKNAQPISGAENRTFSEQLIFPAKLYGREDELAHLLSVFDRVSEGPSEALLIGGYSGVGKSALVHEINKSVLLNNGLFLTGKFDQYQRHTPYSAIAEALGKFIRQLLSLSAHEMESWKERINKVLYPNAQALIDLLPLLGKLIGQQPTLPLVGPEEQENRFNRVFLDFVREVCTSNRPLVFFIDDLQWADTASINLLNLLISDTQSQYCFILGAFRDNEVDDDHPFIQMYHALTNKKARVSKIDLLPLSENSITDIIADTLKQRNKDVIELSALVFKKTNGNPFFFKQFIRELNRQKLLAFDFTKKQWQWSLSAIEQHSITDNVVELMEVNLQLLPTATLEIIKQASCIGSKVLLAELAALDKRERSILSAVLQPAFDAGMLHPTRKNSSQGHSEIEAVTFVHDRIQQAAYSMLSAEQRSDVHYRYGCLLLSQADNIDENTFDILAHLNQTHSRLTNHQRTAVIQLNQNAAQKTKASTAYATAVGFLACLTDLLHLSEHSNNDLKVWAEIEKTECLYLSGRYQQAEELKIKLEKSDLAFSVRIRLKSILITQYTRYGELKRAIEEGLEALHLLDLPLSESLQDIEKEIGNIQTVLLTTPFDQLVKKKDVTNPRILLQLDILMAMQPCCYNSGSNLFPMTILKLLGLTTQYGNSPYSSYIYMMYALLCTKVLKDYSTASEAAYSSEVVAKKYPANPLLEGRLLMMRSNFVMPWLFSLHDSADTRRRAYQKCFSQGDYYWGVHAYIFGFYAELFSSSSIDELLNRTQEIKEVCEQIKQPAQVYLSTLQGNILNILKGSLDNHSNLDHLPGYEEQALAHYQETHYMCGKYDRLLGRLLQGYLFGNYATALDIALNPKLGSDALDEGIFHEAVYTLFNLLNILALKQTNPTVIQDYHEQWFNQAWQKYQGWQNLNNATFSSGYQLVLAELAVLNDDMLSAFNHYEQAIHQAKDTGVALLQALAYERCGQYRKKLGQGLLSKAYTQQAMAIYSAWGANAKSAALEHDLADIDEKAYAGVSDLGMNWRSVISASQGLSQAVTLERLTKDMLSSSVKTTGAQVASMFMLDNGRWRLDSYYQNGEFTAPDHSDQPLPESMLNYSYNSHNVLILNDAINQGEYILDTYVVNRQVRSLLVLPIVVHNYAILVIVLEHDKAANLFTHQRQSMMELLGSQFAITYQNVINYQNIESQKGKLEKAVTRRTAELNEQNQYLETIMQTLPIPFAVTTTEGALLQGNKHLFECFEVNPEESELIRAYDYYVDQHDRDYILKKLDETGSVVDYECQLLSHKGRKFWAQLSTSKMKLNAQSALFTTIKDVSDKRDKELLLQKQAETDPLTNTYNRRAFERLASDIRESTSGNIYVALLDIDYFKAVNDTYGHAAGDEVLKIFCACVQSHLRNGDLLGRVGGEEFGVILRSDSNKGATGVIERLRRLIEALCVPYQNKTITITMSIGMTLWHRFSPLETTMEKADQCLYYAKSNGRNRLVTDFQTNDEEST